MTFEQIGVVGILLLTMGLFIWNHWRYDVVAGLALLASVFLGIVDPNIAFHGFSHPAVITVASVLVISKALQSSGVVELLLRFLSIARHNITIQIAANCGIVGFLSAFMNNIGALALMLPVTLRDASKAARPAAKFMMPLSFASLLGGLVTLIGTPPNIIIASIRAESQGEPFGMFDFTPVGLPVMAGGLLFIILAGWRLIPDNSKASGETDTSYKIMPFITEAIIEPESTAINATVAEFEQLCEHKITVLAILRLHHPRHLAPLSSQRLYQDDKLILQGDTEALQHLFENPALIKIAATQSVAKGETGDMVAMEAIVMPNTMIEGYSMRGLKIRERYGVNLLAVARKGNVPMTGLGRIRFRTGDILLLQGERPAVKQVISTLGCLPFATRTPSFKIKRRSLITPIIFGAGIIAAAFRIMPVQIAFVTTVAALILFRTISLRDVYQSIEWPIVVLLGCLIPVGEALQSTGMTILIANTIHAVATDIPLWTLLAVIILVSMLLSDLIHNTPTAVLMAPIAISMAEALQMSVDPFLMAVAIGAASPYLTPIGHQSNTLVMSPGRYNFSDYWRMGLPLDIIIIIIAVPMIIWVWVN